jgi:hypothetical protein
MDSFPQHKETILTAMEAIKTDVQKMNETEDMKPEVVKEDIVVRVRKDMSHNPWLDFVAPVCKEQRDHLNTQPESRLLALLHTATMDCLKKTSMGFLQLERRPTGSGTFGCFSRMHNAQWNHHSWCHFLQSVCHHF